GAPLASTRGGARRACQRTRFCLPPGAIGSLHREVIYETQHPALVRERAGAHVGLLASAVDVARRRGQLAAQRYVHAVHDAASERPADDASGLDELDTASLGPDPGQRTACESVEPERSGQPRSEEHTSELQS